jgi:hypothetical protein
MLIGQDLRLTIVSTDDDGQRNGPGAVDQRADNPDGPADKKPLNSISEMYAALRGCWTPPPKDDGRHGMEYTVLQGVTERAGSVRRVPATEIEALVIRSVRERLNLSEEIDDQSLIDAHVARVEVRSEQLVI